MANSFSQVKVLTLTEENMAFGGKLKAADEKTEMEKNEKNEVKCKKHDIIISKI